MIYTQKIKDAIKFSIKTHELYQKQKRKGKDIPYIIHPLSVGLILALAGASEDVVVAGVLHDTIEDSVAEKKVTREMLEKRFGKEVAGLVASVTETNKELSWEDRKKEALEHIKDFSHEALMLKSADTINNVSELLEDYRREGEKTFTRFNAPREKIIQHYLQVKSTITGCWSENPLTPDLIFLTGQLEALVASTSIREVATLKKPTQCILWKKETLTSEDLNYQNFELLETFEEESHFSRRLIKCKECGQLYFKEFYEEIDWIDGDDPQYSTYVPVETREEVEILKKTSLFGLLEFTPCLRDDSPKGVKVPKVYWIEK